MTGSTLSRGAPLGAGPVRAPASALNASAAAFSAGDDHGDARDAATPLPVGDAQAGVGRMDRLFDNDLFAIAMEANHTYELTLVPGAPTADPGARLLLTVEASWEVGSFHVDPAISAPTQEVIAAATETAYARVQWSGASGTLPYRLTVRDLGEGENGAVRLAAGASIDAHFSRENDQDAYAVEWVAGKSYEVSFAYAGEGPSGWDGRAFFSTPWLETYGIDADAASPSGTVEVTATRSGVSQILTTGSAQGAYTIGLREIVVDDFGADPAGAGRLRESAWGGASLDASGLLETTGDRDWFAVDLRAGQTYRASVNIYAVLEGDVPTPTVGLFDSGGQEVAGVLADVSGATIAARDFTVARDGTYYVQAGRSTDGGLHASYQVSLIGLPTDDFGQDAAGAGVLRRTPVAVAGEIETAGDQDWFRIKLFEGATYRFSLEGAASGSGTLSDPELIGIHGPDGAVLTGLTGIPGALGQDDLATFAAARTGLHYIAVGAGPGATGTYRLRATQENVTARDDFSAAANTAGRLAPGASGQAKGTIETFGDVDWFKVELSAAKAYRFELSGLYRSHASLIDASIVGIYDAAGRLLPGTQAPKIAGEFNAETTFAPGVGGTYYVAAAGFGAATGDYKLDMEAVGRVRSDDFGHAPAGAGAIGRNGEATGRTESDFDVDWFAVDLRKGATYQIGVEGADTRKGDLMDARLAGVFFEGPNGFQRGTENDSGGVGDNAMIEFAAGRTGTYYIAAAAAGRGTGSYTVAARELVPAGATDDFGSDGRRSPELALSKRGGLGGVIETPGDVDWIAVTLEAGKSYHVNIMGLDSGNGALADPLISGIHDASGTLLPSTWDDDGGRGRDASLIFTAPTSGRYFVAAAAQGDRVGDYFIQVAPHRVINPADSDFDIDIRYQGARKYQKYFEQAAENWERIITGDLSDYEDEVHGLIDDVRIDAVVVPYPAEKTNTLGTGGPQAFRADGTTARGFMDFNADRMAAMEADGTLGEVIKHEMGHVLGVGPSWAARGLVKNGLYVGENALAVYREWTGGAAEGVPLEDEGGGGTLGKHWREALFDNELMTGTAEGDPGMPTSRLTVAALRDLGYEVNMDAADAYAPVFPNPVGAPSTSAAAFAVAAGEAATVTRANPVPIRGVDAALDGFRGAALRWSSDIEVALDFTQPLPQQRLDGPVIQSGAGAVRFFETVTGLGLTVELIGDFEKNDPDLASDVKGTLSAITLNDDHGIAARYDFSHAPRDAAATLADWDGLVGSRHMAVVLADYVETDAEIVTLRGHDAIRGGAGDDVIDGGRGRDVIEGGAGDDALSGGKGKDAIAGGAGDDVVDGGGQHDKLHGGEGDDVLIGGGGRDQFHFGVGDGEDLIRDFRSNVDAILLDRGLWFGEMTAREVVEEFGAIENGAAVLRFEAGEVLTVAGVSRLEALFDDVELYGLA